jgi:hypothetical protein
VRGAEIRGAERVSEKSRRTGAASPVLVKNASAGEKMKYIIISFIALAPFGREG